MCWVEGMNDTIELVKRKYTELARKRQDWPNKYDIGLQCAKMLSDYALLARAEPKGKSILNVGCSEPVDEVFWIQVVAEWHALDINEEIIRVARHLAESALPPSLFGKLRFIVGDATKLGLRDELYDIVVSFSTIDHIPGHDNRYRAISEMVRVLKPGGYLVITVPNKWDLYYSYRSNLAQRRGTAVFGYEYQFSPIELRRMLISTGLRIIDCASTAFNPYSYFDSLLRKLGLAKAKIYFGTRFGFLAQKPGGARCGSR